MDIGKPDETELVIELRPTLSGVAADMARRIRRNGGILLPLGLAVIAGLAGALSYGHNLGPGVIVLGALVAITVLSTALIASLYFAVLGTRWRLYRDVIVLQRPGAGRLEVSRRAISRVMLDSIGGFGMTDEIYRFADSSGRLLFWTVAGRWSRDQLERLWSWLGQQPSESKTIIPFSDMPYDLRY